MFTLPIDPSFLGLSYGGDVGGITIYRNKRGKVVAFPKAPPKCPPTPAQTMQRARFAFAVRSFFQLTADQRLAYENTTRVLSLCLTGQNLWIHFCLMHDDGVWETVQRQSGIALAPPHRY